MTPDPTPIWGLDSDCEPKKKSLKLLGPELAVTFFTWTTALTVFSAATVKSTSLIPAPLAEVDHAVFADG